jgi:hypothetical protein
VNPDDESTFYVNYSVPNSESPLTDLNVGSVTRTLSEAVGREIATVFQEINVAYRSGFIDTAEKESLELVVSILDVVRKTKDYASGLVTFFRDPAADGNITIAEDTELVTAKGEARFVTSERRTLQRGQPRVDVPVRATDASKGPAGIVAAGAITTLAQPIAGIAKITNFDATVLGAADETDDQLRARARATLQSLGKATLAALRRVVLEERAKLTEIWDPNGAVAKRSVPGAVTLLVQTQPPRFQSLQAAVNETRAAGVQTTLVAKYVFFKPRMVITIASGLTAAGKVKVIGQAIDAMQAYVDGLSAGQPASGQDLLKAIAKVKEIGDPKSIRTADVLAWRADIGRPGAETLVDVLIDAVQSAPAGDVDALRAALTAVVTDDAPQPPSDRRVPDRSLVQGPGGQRATDQEIEAGTFQVSATVNGEDWTVVLDASPADFVVVEH